MTLDRYLEDRVSGYLEESIRVDRETGDRDRQRLELIEQFQVTEAASEFLGDFFDRITGEEEGTRRGWNHWLYGYYGSGKSHLLALCGYLLDSDWVEAVGREEIWGDLADSQDGLGDLRDAWTAALDGHYLKPLSLNLLKHQGVRGRSLSSLLLEAANEEAGYSTRPEVAAFEKWYEDTDAWEDREERAAAVLDRLDVDFPRAELWSKIRRYPALAHLVLPRLFEEEVGDTAGFYDLVSADRGPGRTVDALEAWRSQIEEREGRSTKLILLLDEVSLFVGARYQLVTELQALAENIDEEGDGNLLSVATAQARIEDVAPAAARRRVDFSILKDRFPHQYELPSRHVGQIVQVRLLQKTEEQRQSIEDEILGVADLHPRDTLVYREVQQNTSPNLDRIEADDLLDYYPFLPYQLPLFLEILHGLREDVTDRAKSIFSGTARAALALASGLLEGWRDAGEEFRLISLPAYYDIIETELEAAIPGKTATIRAIEKRVDEGELEPIDLDVAKAVLLLGFVPDMIDSTEVENLAVAVRDRLDGPRLLETANQVEDSLGRLATYIRKPERKEARAYRFTESEEREILERAQELFDDEAWGALLDVIGEDFWTELMDELELPAEIPYQDDEELWPVSYRHWLDGHPLQEAEERAGLHFEFHVQGLLPEPERGMGGPVDLVWKAGEEGVRKARRDLLKWASLAEAATRQRTPESIEDDLSARKAKALDAVAGLLRKGGFRVGPSRPSGLQAALREAVREKYPRYYHPAMPQVDERSLRALRAWKDGEPLPSWASTLQVPSSEADQELGAIAEQVRAHVGRALTDRAPRSIHGLLAQIEKEESAWGEAAVRPALVAMMWGLCRAGHFRPLDAEGQPVASERVLDPHRWDEVRLALEDRESVREALERLPEVETTDDLGTARLKFGQKLQGLGRQASGLRDRVEAQHDAVLSEPVRTLLASFAGYLKEKRAALTALAERMSDARPAWGELVTDVLELTTRLEEAKSQWEGREPFLLQMDGLMAIGDQSPDWLQPETRDALTSTRSELEECDGLAWWSSDGWAELRSRLESVETSREGLRQDWQRFLDRSARKTLYETLRDESWLRPSHELPARVTRTRLERQLLRPLRAFRRTVERGEAVVEHLGEAVGDTTAREMEHAIDLLQSRDWFPAPTDEAVEQWTEEYRRLLAVVGGVQPEGMAAVGRWPDDRTVLRQALEELTEERDLTVESVDGDLRIS